jgi:hypothetical protein
MSRLLKFYRRIKNNPKAVSFEDIDKLLRFAGFEVRQPRGGSSHYFYKKGEKYISVPYKRPFVREHYVNRVIELLEGELSFDD